MRRFWATPLLAVLFAVLLVSGASATKFRDYGASQVKPSAFTLAGHGVSFESVRWSRWGSTKAVGQGRLLIYDNVSGTMRKSISTITLDCASGGLFRRARWRYSDESRGRSSYVSGRWVIQQ